MMEIKYLPGIGKYLVASCMLTPIQMATITVELTLELVEVKRTNLSISVKVKSTLESQTVEKFYLNSLVILKLHQRTLMTKILGLLALEFAVYKRLKKNF
jgi:hypothetical protein